MTLARDAIRLMKAEVIDGVITKINTRKSTYCKYNHKERLKSLVDSDGVVLVPSGQHKDKSLHAFTEWLRKRSERIGVNTFKLHEGTLCNLYKKK
jgi:hypothetical protein